MPVTSHHVCPRHGDAMNFISVKLQRMQIISPILDHSIGAMHDIGLFNLNEKSSNRLSTPNKNPRAFPT